MDNRGVFCVCTDRVAVVDGIGNIVVFGVCTGSINGCDGKY